MCRRAFSFATLFTVTAFGIHLSLLLCVFALFHLLLFLGVPWGEAAWGGQQGKRLPKKFRVASLLSSFFFIFSIGVVLSKISLIDWSSPTFSDAYLWFLAALMAVGTVMNTLSPSKPEKLWAPVTALMFVLCLMLQLS